jgi:UPF0755 protein
MRKWLIGSAVVFTLALLAAGASLSFAWRFLNSPMQIDEPQVFIDVPSGTPLYRLSERLAERGLLRHPRILAWYGRLSGDATRIHAGEYRLTPGTTPIALIEKLVSGQVHMHQLTIVEGWRFIDVLRVVRAHPAITATELDGAALMAELGKPDVHPEGQFLPDTYTFPRGTRDVELLGWAHRALERTLDDAWSRRTEAVALSTPYEALILASIIEKETALESERRAISGVFMRRLKRGMRLQTDPTVIYGLGDAFDGDLRRGDLERDTPYNTYTRFGLPPTPIALASAASIEAAVDPEEGDALYFVATGLPDGSHYFSATLEEHNRAVSRYLERLNQARD